MLGEKHQCRYTYTPTSPVQCSTVAFNWNDIPSGNHGKWPKLTYYEEIWYFVRRKIYNFTKRLGRGYILLPPIQVSLRKQCSSHNVPR